MKPFLFAPLRLRAMGKMNASGERAGPSCFHSHSPFASPSQKEAGAPARRSEFGLP
jgi:hypothetical protein